MPTNPTGALRAIDHEKFIEEFIRNGRNATEAYMTTIPDSVNISRSHARRVACAIINEPKWKKRLAALDAKALALVETKHGITTERVLTELARIAFADPRTVIGYDADGRLSVVSASKDLSDDVAASIAGIEPSEYGLKIKFHSKLDALNALAKHLGLLEKSAGVSDKEAGPALIININTDKPSKVIENDTGKTVDIDL